MLLDARYEDTGEPMHEDQVIDENFNCADCRT